MKNTIVKDAAILTAITLIAGLLLGFVYEITKEPIAVQEEKRAQEANLAVFPDAASFAEDESAHVGNSDAILADAGFSEADIDEALAAKDGGGGTLGYVFTVTSHEGYGGDITFKMGVRLDGTLNGIAFLSISETAGLGMKADTDKFKGQFAGRQAAQFAYTKTGAAADNEIDAISGATVTTNAVTNGVNAGLAYFQAITAEMGGGIDE